MNMLFFQEIKKTSTDHLISLQNFSVSRHCKDFTFPTLFRKNLKLSIWGLFPDEESRVSFKIWLNVWEVSLQYWFFFSWNKTFFRDILVKRPHIFGAKFEPSLGFIPSSNKMQIYNRARKMLSHLFIPLCTISLHK